MEVSVGNTRRCLKPKDDFKDCPDCPEMVVLPAGKLLKRQNLTWALEATIGTSFAVGKYAVTFDEWDRCTAAGVCFRTSDGGWGRGSRPVINVSWEDAKQYVGWLKRMTGKNYRLLSEAEFEYAARAGTTTTFPWGDEIGKGNANCDGCGSKWDNKQTAPVGSFKPNAFGLYDMRGNVWQWVEDHWHDSYRGAPSDATAWTEGGDAVHRVFLGGSWASPAAPYGFLARGKGGINFRSNFLGFRVGRTL